MTLELAREVARLREAEIGLRTHIAKVLDGFDHRIFLRDVSRDHENGWGVRVLPYLLALSHLAEFASIPSNKTDA